MTIIRFYHIFPCVVKVANFLYYIFYVGKQQVFYKMKPFSSRYSPKTKIISMVTFVRPGLDALVIFTAGTADMRFYARSQKHLAFQLTDVGGQ